MAFIKVGDGQITNIIHSSDELTDDQKKSVKKFSKNLKDEENLSSVKEIEKEKN